MSVILCKSNAFFISTKAKCCYHVLFNILFSMIVLSDNGAYLSPIFHQTMVEYVMKNIYYEKL